MPISVMPICTVDRKRPGSSARASAALAPGRRSAARARSRLLRAETTASSDREKTPFSAISRTTTISSIRPVH